MARIGKINTTKFVLLLLLFILFSCNEKKTNRIVVCGEILNIEGETSLFGEGLKLKSNTNNNGKFKIVADISNPGYYKLTTGKSEIQLFLFPGDSLYINFVNDQPINIAQFTGDRINESYYLLNYNKIYTSIADTFDIAQYYSSGADKFLATVDKYKEVFIKNLESHKKLNKTFRNIEKQRINYTFAWDKNMYPKNHLIYAGEKAILPSYYFDYLKTLNLNDTSLINLTDYVDFLRTFVEMKYFTEIQNDSSKISDKYHQTKMLLNIIDKNFSAPKIRDYLLNSMILSQINAHAVDSLDIKKFNSLCENETFKANIAQKYKSISSILKGEPAPDFVILQERKTISLTDFKGKYLYIVFWATNSAECRKELPYLFEIEQEFKGRNVAILGICIESTKEAWQKVITENKPAGIQIWLNKEVTDKTKEDFKITSIPTYVLIDKNGKYIDSRAPKPTQNIKDIIRHLPGL